MVLPAQSLSLTVEPIGFIRTAKFSKFATPHQPENSCEEDNVIELMPGRGFERALKDLEGFDRIWLVWWFNRNSNWRPQVLPPRGNGTRRGVFATRSPHRPNPIGLTAVPLLAVSKLKLHVGNTDLLDGTPILDIKPYIKAVDSFPDARSGWLAEVEAAEALPPAWSIAYTPVAEMQCGWLKERGVDFMRRAEELLKRDPSPHRTRRISRSSNGKFRMGCGAWRIFFSLQGQCVLVERITAGYPRRHLETSDYYIADREAQVAFTGCWPE